MIRKRSYKKNSSPVSSVSKAVPIPEIEWPASARSSQAPNTHDLLKCYHSAARGAECVTSTLVAHHTLKRATLDKFQTFILIAPVLLLSMVAHEYAHGYAALKNGDPTAFQLGRLTWNPAKHIDPFMTIIMPLMTFLGSGGTMAFGGAKPVPVNPRNYRNFKKGDIIVSLAGVTTNVIIAIVCVPLIMLVYFVGSSIPALSNGASVLQLMLVYGILLNLALAAFNLIPIPPLDGSHVMKYLLPPGWSLAYQQLARYGIVILLLLLTFGRPVLDLWFRPVMAVNTLLLKSLSPYIIPSPWTS
jgi:Zn-dependent protease